MAQKEAKRAAVAGGEREPPRCRQVSRSVISQFGDYAAESAAFERLLHGKEGIDGARDTQDEKALSRQAEHIDPGGIGKTGFSPGEIGLDPEHCPAGSDRKRKGKARSGAEMDGRSRINFMQGLARKTSAEGGIEGGNAERQHVLRGKPSKMLKIRHRAPKGAQRD